MRRRFVITLLLVGSLAAGAYAQEDPEAQLLPQPTTLGPLRFEQLSLEDGLTQSSVRAIVQDRQGFLWLGTEEGLNRFDGYAFTVFKYVPFDTMSLSNNSIRTLLEDRTGTLWIGTQDGLNRMDAETGRFTRYQPPDSLILGNYFIGTMAEDAAGILWLGTGNGLHRFDPQTGQFTGYLSDPQDSTSLSNNFVPAIYEDDSGVLWLGTARGLNRMDPEQPGLFTRFLMDHIIWSITGDPRVPGVLWLGSRHSLIRFETETGATTSYLDGANVRDFTPDPVNPTVLWVATFGQGLYRFDTRTGAATHYQHNPSDPGSLPTNAVSSLLTDQSGMVWAGAESRAGVTRFDPTAGGFVHYRHVPGDPNSLPDGNVWQLLEDRDGILWAAVAEGAAATRHLVRIDRAAGTVTRFSHDPDDPNTLAAARINQILEDRDGAIWVHSFSTISRLDRATGRVTRFQHDPNDPRSLSSNSVVSLFEDEAGTLWVATQRGGLNRFDRATDTFTRYGPTPEQPDRPRALLAILEDHKNQLWVGSLDRGLNLFDPETGAFTAYLPHPEDTTSQFANSFFPAFVDRLGTLWGATFGPEGPTPYQFDPDTDTFSPFPYDPANPNSFSDNIFSDVYEREREPGILWVATQNGGLDRFDTQTFDITHYSDANGLPSNYVYGILEDAEGRLWMSTNGGLTRLDPDTGDILNYDVTDGLQSNEFNGGSFFQSPRTGEMFFGGIHGITAFHPRDIVVNTVVPSIVLTDFRVFNESVTPGPDAPLTTSISRAEEIQLKHSQKSIAFDFVGLHFQNPEKNEYAVMLEGFDDDWVEAGTQRTAAYTNLDPGDYTFRVRAANSDGVWNETGASVRVVVAPPWWKTWWAYLFYAVFLVGLVVAIDRVQRARLIRKERQRAEIEQAELRAGAAEAQARALQAENERKQIELEKSKELEQAYLSLEATHEQLAQSHTIVEAINKETGFPLLLHTILDEARIIPGVEKATALVYDATLDAFVFGASSGWDVEHLRPIRMTADEAHARYVAHTEEVAEDIFAAKDAAARPGAERFAALGMAASFLVLRIRVEGEVTGYLIFDNMTDRDAFDYRDAALLEGLREHIRSAFIKTCLLEDLHEKNVAISEALNHLQTTQAQLVQSEKMASLGQLTAGIAHEIKNPLNFVNNFAQLCTELADEVADELDAHDDAPVSEVRDDLKGILNDLKVNATKIEEHGKRADGIVKSMLLHSGGKAGERRLTDVNGLLDEYVNLAYHGKQAQVSTFNVTLEHDYDEAVGEVDLVPQEIGRVFINLLNNAFDAVQERMSTGDGVYTPTVSVATRRRGQAVEIEVRDNGTGMPSAVAQKIFEPFYTTKPTGSGTGLGLSMSYDIVTQGHGGTLAVESEEGRGATFVVTLPV